ncbi:MAG: amidohydrolase family protein [Thermoplasmata archaeon]|nr:amidohydrolase family protein [Thermoplasmata archaeon]
MAAAPGSDGRPRAGSDGYELVVTGRAWLDGKLRPVEVGVDEDGWIRRIARNLRDTGHRLDFGESVLLPAATDVHVHFRDPDGPDPAESFASGTEGAALGGIGAVGEMPNTRPPVDDRERWEEKAALARGRIAVDVVLYGSAQSPAAVRSLAPVAGALKLYLAPTTGVEDFPIDRLPEVLEAVAAVGLPLSVHAEWPPAFSPSSVPPSSTEGWNASRPPAAERAAVDRLLRAPSSLRLHIAHATEADTVDRVAGGGISCEATPHHLLLRARSDGDGFAKTNPPLRSEADRRALWDRFASGAVPLLASDHAPHHSAAKEGPFSKAPSGVPGVETMVPLMLELVRSGDLPLPVLLGAAMDRPARWFGLPMGRLAPGHWANLIAIDFRRGRKIEGKHLRSPAGWSPFEGRRAVFPHGHLRRGEILVADGEFVGPRNGAVVRPEYVSTVSRNVPNRFVTKRV